LGGRGKKKAGVRKKQGFVGKSNKRHEEVAMNGVMGNQKRGEKVWGEKRWEGEGIKNRRILLKGTYRKGNKTSLTDKTGENQEEIIRGGETVPKMKIGVRGKKLYEPRETIGTREGGDGRETEIGERTNSRQKERTRKN